MKNSDPNDDNSSDLPTSNFDDLWNIDHPNIEELLKDVNSNIEELLKDNNPNIEELLKHVNPNIEELLKDVNPNIDELLKHVNPNIEELLKDVNPNIDELLKDVRPLATEDEPLAPPDPSLTAADAAKWMKEEVERTNHLDQEHAVWYVKRHFGDRFTLTNENGNLAFAPEVLNEFRKITEHTVVWCKPERYWRKRRPDDSPRREVRY